MKALHTISVAFFLFALFFFFSSATWGQRFQPWAKRAEMPSPRNSLVGTVYSGKIYLYGGNGDVVHSRSKQIVIYEPATNLWSIGSDAPTGRGGHAFVTVNDKLYTFGGEGPSAGTWNNQIAVYNPATNAWELKNNWVSPRNSMASGVINGKVYLAGGRTGYGATLAINQEYDPITDTWSPKAPLLQHRIVAASAVYNNKLYVFGGNSKSSELQNTPLASVEVYDPISDTWENKAPLPFPIYNGCAVLKEGNIYLLTSPTTESNLLTHLLKYSPDADNWDILSENEDIRTDGSLVQFNNLTFYFGGLDNSSQSMLTTTYFTVLKPENTVPFDTKIKLISATSNGIQISVEEPTIIANPGETLSIDLGLETDRNHPGSVAPFIGTTSWGAHDSSFWLINSNIPNGNIPQSVQKTIIFPTDLDSGYIFFSVAYEIGGEAVASLTNYTGSPIWNDGVDVADWNEKQARFAIDSGYTYTLVSNGGQYWSSTCAAAAIKIVSQPTGVKNSNLEINSFVLSQNYPNPFNPATTITYALPFESNVKLTVYNTLGQEVKELVKEVKGAGIHKIDFDGSTLSSGVYFYSLTAQSLDGKNNFSSVKKLLLLK